MRSNWFIHRTASDGKVEFLRVLEIAEPLCVVVPCTAVVIEHCGAVPGSWPGPKKNGPKWEPPVALPCGLYRGWVEWDGSPVVVP